MAAAQYVLTVSTTADMSTLVAGMPISVATPQTTVTLPAGTYFWTVVSDVTQDDVRPSGQLFGVLGDSAYVYCAAASDCAAAPDELGTIARPYHSLDRGIIYAAAQGITTVVRLRVATAARRIPIRLPRVVNGVNVTGGYDPSFSVRSDRTAITLNGAALVAVDVTTPTTIDGFAMVNSNSTADASSVIRVTECTQDLTISNISATAATLTTDVVHVEDGRDSVGPMLVNSAISGTYDADRIDGRDGLVLVSVGGAIRLSGVTVRGQAPYSITQFYGIFTLTAPVALSLDAVDMTITGGRNGIAVNLSLSATFDIVINRSRIEVVGVSTSNVTAINGGSARSLTITGSTISAHDAGTVMALNLPYGVDARLASNFITTDAAQSEIVAVFAGGDARIAGNTIVTGTAGLTVSGLQRNGGRIDAVNNLFVGTTFTCVGSSPACRSQHLGSVSTPARPWASSTMPSSATKTHAPTSRTRLCVSMT